MVTDRPGSIQMFDDVCIDPGSSVSNGIGWMGANGDEFLSCGLIRPTIHNPYKDLHFLPGARKSIVMERPQIYPGPRQKADPNDLVQVGVVGGIAVGFCLDRGGQTAQVKMVAPGSWKGQVPGEIFADRIRQLMSSKELTIFERVCSLKHIPKSLQHNVLDAIGLWMWSRGVI